MEECESLDSEMTELQEYQCEASEGVSQDDEDEVEELQNSLREIVQDPSVKPKLQCLMVDPSFSMVTVQSEDSGIVWETASSRCSTPWASETSSISEGYSMESSGAAGKITIVFDEDKIVRRRTRSGGRSSRLGDRLSRPGSSRSASALGTERPEMAEVSLPNIKQEKTEAEPDLEEIKNKDQQLFSLISEGYEILNIRVPSKLPTVDEEESTELQDNLSYLDQTPKIRSRNHHDWTRQQNHVLPEQEEISDHQESSKQDSSQPSEDTEPGHTPTQKESTSDIDYFEKFTLLDEVVPGEQAPELQEKAEQPAVKPQGEEQKPAKETPTDNPPSSEDSFVFVTDVDIVGEHLDEVFYGEGAPADALQRRDEEEAKDGARMRLRRESSRSMKESGSVLFGSEETVLTPIYISPGPPKIIDLILLEEPTAMSFMYSDLYEDAVGERRKSDEEFSEAEGLASEKSYKRCLSDSEEEDDYLEKFILKDETPTMEVQPESVEDNRDGKMMWSQSKFEMTGCLTRVVKEEDEEETKAEAPKTKEVSAEDRSKDLQPAASEEKREIVTDTEKVREEIQPSMVTEEQAVREASEESVQDSKLTEDQKEGQEVKHEVKKDQTEPPESSIDEPLPEIQEVDTKAEKTEGESEEHQREEHERSEQSIIETEQPNKEKEAAEVVPEDAAPVEVITDCDCAVQAVVEVTERAVNEKEIQTQVQIDLQEVTSVGTTDVRTAAPEGEKEHKALTGETAAESWLPEFIAEADQESEVKTEPSNEVTKPVMPEEAKTDSDEKHHEILESLQHQQAESVTDSESDKTKLMTEVKAQTPADDTEAVVQEMVNVGDELILLVPKGQAVEMDIDIGQWSDKTTNDAEALPEPDGTCEHLIAPEDAPAPVEETKTELQLEVEPELAEKVEELPRNDLDGEYPPPAPVEEAATKEKKMEEDLEEDESVLSPLRSFSPQDDLSVLHREDMLSEEADLEQKAEIHKVEDAPEAVVIRGDVSPDIDVHREDMLSEEAGLEQKAEMHKGEDAPEAVVIRRDVSPDPDLHREDMLSEEADLEQKAEMHKVDDAPEAVVIRRDVSPDPDLHREDIVQKMEQDEEVVKVPEEPIEELEYELISKQDAEDMPQPEIQRDAEESKPESGQDREERVEVEVGMEMELELELEEKGFGLSPEEEVIEADYEIIDAEEESQARLAAELQGMDWFCLSCGCLLSEDDCVSGEHRSHDVTAVDKAYEEIKEKLSDWIAELQGRSENIEDLVSELELGYNSVEDQCVESEAAMQAQNEEMMALVMEQYNNMSVSMEEEKKAKLEQLYDQIVSFQDSIDSAKATLETTAREAETDARSPKDIHARLKEALDSAMSLELGPRGLLVFEDYAKGNASSSHLAQRKGIPVPQKPTLQPQEPGSATSTSVTVYWKVNPGDIIDCFQVYCMEDPQGAVSEEYRVTVKESYCVLEELEPDKTYKVWVMAVNYTGCSLPSERLAFTTAPSVPGIDTDRCTVTWDSATLRWQKQTAGHSYTLEYCRQYELEGEGLRSISGIKGCEQRVLLQPNENYLFYIKAVNEAGASEQSEAALISTKGTRFHLLKASAHPALELSVDQTTLHYCQDTYENTPFTDKQCPSILGELLPARGHYYWETVVSESTAYRLGVAYGADRDSSLGENSLSWCLQCIPAPSGCRYQLLHNDIQSSVFVIEMPERVGTLLDYQLGRLSFYNAHSGQLLGAFSQRFTQPCHPALALEMPGSLEVSMLPEVPEFTKDS